jgi:FixJ family two-component response regulator
MECSRGTGAPISHNGVEGGSFQIKPSRRAGVNVNRPKGRLALQSRPSELGSTLPIVLLAGHPDIPTTVAAIKAGAVDFLTKPILPNELLRVVERAIYQRVAAFARSASTAIDRQSRQRTIQ